MKTIISTIDLGKTIRQMRKRQGLTQLELSGLSGVGVRFLSELERGKNSCEIGKTLKILQMLGISLYASNPEEV